MYARTICHKTLFSKEVIKNSGVNFILSNAAILIKNWRDAGERIYHTF